MRRSEVKVSALQLAETWVLPPGFDKDFTGILEKNSLMFYAFFPYHGNRDEDVFLLAFSAVFSLCIFEMRLFSCFMSYTAHHKGILASAEASRGYNNCNKSEGYCTQRAT